MQKRWLSWQCCVGGWVGCCSGDGEGDVDNGLRRQNKYGTPGALQQYHPRASTQYERRWATGAFWAPRVQNRRWFRFGGWDG